MGRPGNILAAIVTLALAGCGSSTGGADGGGTGGTPGAAGHGGAAGHDAGAPTGEITWLANGTPHGIAIGIAARRSATMTDTLEIVGADGVNPGLSIELGTPTTLGGTYSCGADGGTVVLITYDNMIPSSPTCTVTVAFVTGADGKPHATGTFDFSFAGADGGAIDVTGGHFDIPVSMETP